MGDKTWLPSMAKSCGKGGHATSGVPSREKQPHVPSWERPTPVSKRCRAVFQGRYGRGVRGTAYYRGVSLRLTLIGKDLGRVANASSERYGFVQSRDSREIPQFSSVLRPYTACAKVLVVFPLSILRVPPKVSESDEEKT
eukprot:scaffold1016_cov258-Pinguiococcus_pyrenoidosus.AAC.6